MKIAVAGKGGSGKTTLAATLARVMSRRGRPVLAIDGDSNPNLAAGLGMPADQASTVPPVPGSVMHVELLSDGNRKRTLIVPPTEVIAKYGVHAPDGVTLLVMGRVGHAGAG